MVRLEDLSTGTRLTGPAPSGTATVETVQWIGEQALKVIYRDGGGQLGVAEAPAQGTTGVLDFPP